MAKNRRSSCPHCIREPLYTPLRHEEGYTAPEEAESALAGLAEALTALAGFRPQVFGALSEQDVANLLTPAPPPVRRYALWHLGLRLAPRVVSRSLCRDVRQRLTAVPVDDACHAVDLLSGPVKSAILRSVAHPRTSAPQWSDTLLACTLWASVTASAEGARALLWASDRSWWPGNGADPAALDELLDAARKVVEATPDFVHRMYRESAPVHEPPDPSAPEPEELPMSAGAEAAETPAAAPQDLPGHPAPSLDLLRGQRSDLERCHHEAEEALTALGEALTGEQRIPEAPLRALADYNAAFDRLAAHLDLPAPAAEARFADLDAALAALAEREDADARILALLDLAELPDIPADQIAVLHGLVEEGAEAEEGVPLREALLALGELVELSATEEGRDPVRMSALQSRAMKGLPDELASLPLAVILRQTERSRPQPPAPGPVASASPGRAEPPDPGAPGPGPAAKNHPDALPEPLPAEEPAPEPPAPEPPDLEQPAPAPLAPAQPDPVDEGTEPVLVRLVTERRFALAASIADTSGHPAPRSAALRIAALADVLRSGTGPCAARLRDELAALDPDDLTGDTPALILTVPALVRTALVTGESTAGALLDNAAPHLEPHLSAIAQAVGQRALKGLLVGNPLGTTLADAGQLEERLDRVRHEAGERLRTPHNLRFRRATKLAQVWFAEQGPVGSLLHAAANDDRSRCAEVAERLVALTRRENLNKEIDRADAALRGPSSRVLQGAARNNLVSLVGSALAVVSDWLDAVSALERGEDRSRAWATDDLVEMRHVVLRHAPQAAAALAGHSSHTTLAGAAHAAAAEALREIAAFVDGGVPTGQGEPLPDHVLTVELLKVAHATVDPATGRVRAPEGTTSAQLAAAAGLDWSQALDLQIRSERYPAARHLVDLAETGGLPQGSAPVPQDARDRIDAAEKRSRDGLARARDELLTELGRARLQQEISEEQDSHLTELLEVGSVTEASDLAPVRARIEQVARDLPAYRREAASRLTERLDALVKRAEGPEVDERRIRSLIEDGQLLTAEELIYFSEIGESVPEPFDERELPDFFPRVPDGLPRGITAELVEMARRGGVLPLEGGSGLDFGGLSTDARDLVADALEAWREARDTPIRQRNQLGARAVRTFLVPALRLLGYDIPASASLNPLRAAKGLDRGSFEFSRVAWNGRPTVPQFGSKLHGRLRVMVCWSQPRAELLRSWVDKDTSGDSLLVAYMGTMPSEVRRRFAVEAVHSDTSVVVVDDAALAYLAAHGNRQVDTALAVLLPFSAVQPYARKKRSLVPPEMFYGRDRERRAVIDPEDTQVLFGGRGLGKSALLRSAKTAFEQEPERVALHIELSTAAIGQGAQGADAVWDVLLRELRGAGVVSRPGKRDTGKAYDQVRAGVLAWLTADSRRRLLVMLDESDGFFEADAPRFLETRRLKELGQLAGAESRAKVVFAGLHSVQRFAKLSNNTFKHLAQSPTMIGHLRPFHAYDLVTRPMGALGFRFESEELIHRILGHCSYQPFLLQMFCDRLVRHMHDMRRTGTGGSEPPYIVALSDVEAVEGDPELRDDIIETFRDTLHLDPRYNIIANVLAHHAYERGLDVRLTEMELREECLSYWRRGFEGLDSEAFRAYLKEMVGLGLLADNRDLRGWRLRSANALRMMGTNDTVMTALVDADSEAVPAESIALTVRRPLGDRRLAPLTTAQLDYLLGDHANQVRLVLGSPATGIADVTETIRSVRDEFGDRFDLQEPQDRRRYEEALEQGRKGRRRIVLSDLSRVTSRASTCLAGVEAALERTPTGRGVTRSVVLVSDPTQADFWEMLLAGPERDGLGLVRLRRYDRLSLQVWSRDTGLFGVSERQEHLLEITGGWPVLVDRAQELAQEHQEKRALERLAKELAQPGRAAALVEQVGLTAHRPLAAAFDAVIELIDGPTSRGELVEAVGLREAHPDPDTAVACLEALDVFDQVEEDTYRVEPLLARCWQHRGL
ncbi:hypothetical protein [Nocardiopsis algeriensis]|uniref:AAA domain-containing protein n=1 Tax=Nocardiopsis algeriensis TaxID=1478215 RepID=A0A841ISD0_9ACTN|nr:hypothetical protein [Nocardiopsis algeriensis]MBB6119515.1 hypothetical protein [Nocardiopsis algeriensis]